MGGSPCWPLRPARHRCTCCAFARSAAGAAPPRALPNQRPDRPRSVCDPAPVHKPALAPLGPCVAAWIRGVWKRPHTPLTHPATHRPARACTPERASNRSSLDPLFFGRSAGVGGYAGGQGGSESLKSGSYPWGDAPKMAAIRYAVGWSVGRHLRRSRLRRTLGQFTPSSRCHTLVWPVPRSATGGIRFAPESPLTRSPGDSRG